MKTLLTLLTPPVAACRYGCASCCAAPIGVFWLTGIVSILYGALWGGPADGTGWQTIVLGLGLWGIAATWAYLSLRNTDSEGRDERSGRLCSKILPSVEEPDPFDEVRKAR
ncbi:MAG: hypothetical protein WCY26_05810 [Thiohalobacteraceae bacterium]|nr:hypothetical protein [Gammaproteobacteria bacterium]